MRKDRWRDLDLAPPARKSAEPAGAECLIEQQDGGARRIRHGALSGLPPSRHTGVAAARGFYLLRNWPRVVEVLTPEALGDPAAGGAWLLRGLALARLQEWE